MPPLQETFGVDASASAGAATWCRNHRWRDLFGSGSIDQEFGIATTTSPMSNTSGSLGLLSKLGYLCWMVILVFSV